MKHRLQRLGSKLVSGCCFVCKGAEGAERLLNIEFDHGKGKAFQGRKSGSNFFIFSLNPRHWYGTGDTGVIYSTEWGSQTLTHVDKKEPV